MYAPTYQPKEVSTQGILTLVSSFTIVGILVVVLELPWVLVGIGVAMVPVSRIWRGPVAIALGGLHCEYQ